MSKQTILIGLIIIVLSAGYLEIKTATSAAGQQAGDEKNAGSHMLEATVLITMYGFRSAEYQASGIASQPDGTLQAEGLGTLVDYNGHPFIVTHDHWSLAKSNLELVQIRNARGELVAQMSGDQFMNQVRYRDGGTMVLGAPAGIENSVEAVPWDGSPDVLPGDRVQIVHRAGEARDGLGTTNALVETIRNENGVQAFVLKTEDGKVIVPGDSGGGIWYQGAFVGNMWLSLTVNVETPEAIARTEANWAQAATLTQGILGQLDAVPQVAPAETVSAGQLETDTPDLPPVSEEGGIG